MSIYAGHRVLTKKNILQEMAKLTLMSLLT